MIDDPSSFAAGMAAPGNDPRGWVTYGIVEADTPSSRSVLFKDEQGNPLPFPLVLVALQPSGVVVPCRVASRGAGAGEGDWEPVVAGAEVVVVIPHGDEREGGIILGQLNQRLDSFPTSVAGNDPTTNTFTFMRRVMPIVLESGASILLHTSPTNAFVSVGQTGNVTAQSGDGHYLTVSHDFVGLQLADTSALIQLNASTSQIFLQAQGTQLLLDPGGQSHLLTTGAFSVGTAGSQPQWHVATTEAVANMLAALLVALGAVSLPGGPTGAAALATALAALTTPALAQAFLAAVVGTAAPLPMAGALQAAIAAALQAGTVSGPNVGVAGFLVG